MKLFQSDAMMELDKDESARMRTDEKYRKLIFERAQHMSDITGRTVLVYLDDGELELTAHTDDTLADFEKQLADSDKAAEQDIASVLAEQETNYLRGRA